MKKPFSIRVEQNVINKFKALSTVLNIDGAKLLNDLVIERIDTLDENEKAAYDALIKIWND